MRMQVAFLCGVIAVSGWAAAPETKLPNGRADVAAGRKLFEHHCALCHGPQGEGGRGPMLAKARLSRAPNDAALVNVVENGIRGTEMPGASSMSEREVRQTAAYVRALGKVQMKPPPGNAARGAEVYRAKGACAGCHALNGEGEVSGPDLAGIGERRSAAYLREALLTPEAALPDGYLLVTVSPRNGGSVTGARVNEDSFSIQVLDATGRTHSFWKSDAEVKKQAGKSPMPSYKGTLLEEEVTDLVAYLASLKEGK